MHLTEDLLSLLRDGVSRHVDSTCALPHLGQTDVKGKYMGARGGSRRKGNL